MTCKTMTNLDFPHHTIKLLLLLLKRRTGHPHRTNSQCPTETRHLATIFRPRFYRSHKNVRTTFFAGVGRVRHTFTDVAYASLQRLTLPSFSSSQHVCLKAFVLDGGIMWQENYHGYIGMWSRCSCNDSAASASFQSGCAVCASHCQDQTQVRTDWMLYIYSPANNFFMVHFLQVNMCWL